MSDLTLEEITEYRCLDVPLENKLLVNGFSGNYLRWCMYTDCGISRDNKSVYYTQKDKERIKRCFELTHGITHEQLLIMSGEYLRRKD